VDDAILRGRVIVDVAAGEHFTLASAADGGMVGWGDGNSGQLGLDAEALARERRARRRRRTERRRAGARGGRGGGADGRGRAGGRTGRGVPARTRDRREGGAATKMMMRALKEKTYITESAKSSTTRDIILSKVLLS
jgi:hypothetical protein